MKSEKFIIANWKMQLDPTKAEKLARDIKRLNSRADKNTKLVICPGFLSIVLVKKALSGSRIALGAQDGFYEDYGPFTGMVSLAQIKGLGCQYVILGHSERRAQGETDQMVNKKVLTALRHGLTPIVCVGETFDERKEGNRDLVLVHQVYEAMRNVKLKPSQKIVIAYEPVWVIGSGQAVEGKDAEHAAAVIRQSFLDSLGKKNMPALSVIYGGSVSGENIAEFTDLDDITGALVGGASLDAKKFTDIIKNA